ncbi:MAG TPA: peptidase MA family metallohydrolase [Polyangiaceae bacterium]|nr:peptidase MA family metallohydrolase [Polyangiaceae bacterium]
MAKFLVIAITLGLLTTLGAVLLGGHGSLVRLSQPAAHRAATTVTVHPETAGDGPLDSPQMGDDKLRLPNPPAGFAVEREGFIDFAYPPETRARIAPLMEQAANIRREYSARFGRDVLGSVRVHVARTPGEMATLAPHGAPFPSYASGVAYPEIGYVLLTIYSDQPGTPIDLLEVFRHELAHVALYDALGGHAVPRWLNEGFAIHLSGESSLTRVGLLWPAVLADNVLPFSQLDRGFAADSGKVNLAYAESADVVRYLLRTRDAQRFDLLLNSMRGGANFDTALGESYKLDLAGLEYEWREDASQRYTFWPVLLSGSMVWVGIMGLFVLAWRRHRRRQQVTLERWAREEKQEELQKQAQARLHIVLAPAPKERAFPSVRVGEVEVPKVEHDGNWHTLH